MRVLFFMAWAGRTGSEVALYNYICAGAGRGMEMGVACSREGELLRELPPEVPAFIYGNRGLLERACDVVYRKVARSMDDRRIAALHRKFKPDLWYVNTILQPGIISQARRHNVPCVLHTHELEQILWSLNEREVRELIDYPKLVVAGSQSAKDVLVTLGRRADIEVCYENINPEKIVWNAVRSREIREEMKVGPGTFVWATSGSLDPNKNPVRFVEIAGEMLRSGMDVHFMWLGGTENGYSLYAKELAERAGISEKISWLGARSADYYDYLNAVDGLVVTSFKESFSIVTVEAAYLGKPVVSFNCVGVKEIIREGMGTIVESWNTTDLIGAMQSVMKGETGFNPDVSRERVKEFYIGTQGERWRQLLKRYFA